MLVGVIRADPSAKAFDLDQHTARAARTSVRSRVRCNSNPVRFLDILVHNLQRHVTLRCSEVLRGFPPTADTRRPRPPPRAAGPPRRRTTGGARTPKRAAPAGWRRRTRRTHVPRAPRRRDPTCARARQRTTPAAIGKTDARALAEDRRTEVVMSASTAHHSVRLASSAVSVPLEPLVGFAASQAVMSARVQTHGECECGQMCSTCITN